MVIIPKHTTEKSNHIPTMPVDGDIRPQPFDGDKPIAQLTGIGTKTINLTNSHHKKQTNPSSKTGK